jgi:adenine-specific DNA-methyltransferase
MPTKEELRNRLIEKLKELFQLDRPELDFGLYRIMHAKDEEVTDYLENGLPATLEEALGDVNQEEVEQRRREYEEELQTAKDYGVENPEEADKVQDAKERLEAAKESAGADKKVYDHLYRFFSRYYEKGDFITRRYRVRETDTQAAPYAIPYDGEEVKLHWANADQYYIKTAEHLRNFRFDLREAVEETADGNAPDLGLNGDEALPVHFRVVDGEEGEHDNVKDADNKVRKLKPYTPDLLEVTDEGELVVNFEVVFQKSQGEYIYDSEMEDRLEDKYGAGPGKSDKEPLAVAETVFDHLGELEELDSVYESLLSYVPPPDNKATPPLLAQYYDQFADKHEMDYFIHKDLGGFLRRELDFYIKNEVMRLDDIQRAEVPRVESYLDIVKALRLVGHDIIDFLSQLEDFQKKLWLKKKFVVDTGYCVTLDRVPDTLYDNILENDDQLQEWRDLYAIEEWDTDLSNRGYEDGVFTRDFLEAHPHVMIDTEHFGDGFTDHLLAQLGDEADGGLTKAVDGRCLQSENFQSLKLINKRYKNKITTFYIDPPFNTENKEFVYKDSYKHSSWISMMQDRLKEAKNLMSKDAIFWASINDVEFDNLVKISENIFGKENKVANIIWENKEGGGGSDSSYFRIKHEYIISFAKEKSSLKIKGVPITNRERYRYKDKHEEERGPYYLQKLNQASIQYSESLDYPINAPDGTVVEPDIDGKRACWRWSEEKVEWGIENDFVVFKESKDGDWKVYTKQYLKVDNEGNKIDRTNPPSPIIEEYSNVSATKKLDNLFGYKPYDYPKPDGLIEYLAKRNNTERERVVADFFAGSGTTGHSVVNLKRNDSGDRKYLLVEMGDYFNTVLIPRLKKAVFSDDWDDGVPERIDGQSHVIKYHRLESYEDTLNNLELNEDEDREAAHEENEDLRRDYRLHYMLDVETEGSPSLLDIDEFTDPRQYHLQVKKPGSDASTQTSVDLLETFNYLLGLRVEQIDVPETFTAEFHRPEDPELPEDKCTRLEIDGEMELDEDGDWWFRTVTGWVPSDPMNPDDSDRERVLVIWRTLTDDREQDNSMLNAYIDGQPDDFLDADRVYVNGSNNLASLRREDEDWEVHLLEKEFMERMWDVQEV